MFSAKHTFKAIGSVVPPCPGTLRDVGVADGRAHAFARQPVTKQRTQSRDVRCAARTHAIVPALIDQPSKPLLDIPADKLPFIRNLSEPAQWAVDRVLEDIVLPAVLAFALIKVVDLLAESAAKVSHRRVVASRSQAQHSANSAASGVWVRAQQFSLKTLSQQHSSVAKFCPGSLSQRHGFCDYGAQAEPAFTLKV